MSRPPEMTPRFEVIFIAAPGCGTGAADHLPSLMRGALADHMARSSTRTSPRARGWARCGVVVDSESGQLPGELGTPTALATWPAGPRSRTAPSSALGTKTEGQLVGRHGTPFAPAVAARPVAACGRAPRRCHSTVAGRADRSAASCVGELQRDLHVRRASQRRPATMRPARRRPAHRASPGRRQRLPLCCSAGGCATAPTTTVPEHELAVQGAGVELDRACAGMPASRRRRSGRGVRSPGRASRRRCTRSRRPATGPPVDGAGW